MAVGGTRGAGVTITEVPPTDAEDVRHFDQLRHDEQHAFIQLYRGYEPPSVPLDAGEVIVFTDYYRVER